jgi:hypothetical protein
VTGVDLSPDDILARFAVAFREDPAVLGRYCLEHPELASQFVALAHEIALQETQTIEVPLDVATEKWIEAACADHLRPAHDPFAGLSGQSYTALRQAVGVPSVVLNAFRDRIVAGGTVPLGFLARLADALGTGVVELAAYLAGPPRLAKTVSHKSDRAPQAAAGKVSFAEVLGEAGLSPEQAASLLADDD